MRQGITTKYVGPTNARGSRIIATTASGVRRTFAYDYAKNLDENHAQAAFQLATELRWNGRYFGGATKDGYVFVHDDKPCFDVE